VLCLSNKRQIMIGWHVYAGDHDDRMVRNSWQPTTVRDFPDPSWVIGRMSWSLKEDNTNLFDLTENRNSLLVPYAGKAPGIYRCPSDRFLLQEQHASGWDHRIRSVSMNTCMGDGRMVARAWEKPAAGFSQGIQWFRKLGDLRELSPARALIVVDEHPDSIDDGTLGATFGGVWFGAGSGIPDLPSNLHTGGFTAGCADGHAEIIRFKAFSQRRRVIYQPYPIGDEHVVTKAEERDFWEYMSRITLPAPP
jgi:hypothetical protein